MPIMICSKCHKPVPDSFHDFEEICSCKTRQEWINHYKKNKWILKIDGKKYDFTIAQNAKGGNCPYIVEIDQDVQNVSISKVTKVSSHNLLTRFYLKKWLTIKEEQKLVKILEKKGSSKMIRKLQEILSKKGFYEQFFT